jgi:predicted lipoprotein with Yx(FWY)xxD motif
MRPLRFKILAGAFAAALVLSACGDDDSDTEAGRSTTTQSTERETTTTTAATAESTTTTAATGGEVVVTVGMTNIGDVLVNKDNLTLYGFTNDTNGMPSCSGGCATTWPPLVVDGPDLPASLDPAVFKVVQRPDGTYQLVAGMWPLYTYSGDASPGDVNGQGIGGVWFAVGPDGTMIQES